MNDNGKATDSVTIQKIDNQKPIKPIIGIPIERQINEKAFYSFIGIAQRGYPVIQNPYMRNDMARQRFVWYLLEQTDCTHLVMLDSDHIHPMDIVDRFISQLKKNPEIKVLGGLNFRRGEPYDPCVFLKDKDSDSYYTIKDWDKGLIKVDILGTGSVIIAREVFEELPQPWFAYNYDRVEQKAMPGVDIHFSKLCNEYNIDLWCDTTITSPHIIDGLVGEQTYKAYLEHHSIEEIEEKFKVRK